jgi:hypothetical protein
MNTRDIVNVDLEQLESKLQEKKEVKVSLSQYLFLIQLLTPHISGHHDKDQGQEESIRNTRNSHQEAST